MRQLWISGNTLPRNLKPKNILIKKFSNREPKAYIADVGIAIGRNNTILEANFTPLWMAPELLAMSESPSSTSECLIEYSKCDIFSIGLIALYCIDHHRFKSYQEKILDKTNRFNINPDRLESYLNLLSRQFPHSLINKIHQMLSYNPKGRKTLNQLFKDILTLEKRHLRSSIFNLARFVYFFEGMFNRALTNSFENILKKLIKFSIEY